MIKETLTYTDFNGDVQTDDFYFNLTEAEVLELNVREDLEKIGKSGDNSLIMDTFKRVIKASYGTRINNGKDFVKEERDYKIFIAGQAYSNLFIDLVKTPEKAAIFIKGIMPAGMAPADTAQQPAQTPRERSEAQMQGHQAPQYAAPPASIPQYLDGTVPQGGPVTSMVINEGPNRGMTLEEEADARQAFMNRPRAEENYGPRQV